MTALVQSFLPFRAYAIASSVHFPLLTSLGPSIDALFYCASSLRGPHPLDAPASLTKLSYFSFRPCARLSLRLARITLALLLRLSRNYTTSARRLREGRERFNLTAADTDDEADRDADARNDATSLRVGPDNRSLVVCRDLIQRLVDTPMKESV